MEQSEKNYKDFCEKIFEKWTEDKEEDKELEAFKDDFQTDYMPEFYYTVEEGKNPLIVLNNNPGKGEEFQKRDNIKKAYPKKTYDEIARVLYAGSSNLKEINDKAKGRISSMEQFYENVGLNGVEDVETFFLHSKKIKKDKFLKKYAENSIVKEYTQKLKEYLKDKTVLYLSGGKSIGNGITKDWIVNNEWLKNQMNIIDMDINKASLIPLKTKNNKTTTAILVQGKKLITFRCGTNGVPSISSDQWKEIKLAMSEIK